MSEQLDPWKTVILGAVEGLTEFLSVSSTGHLTILEKLFGYEIDAPDVTAFTAIIQLGAILAAVIYFRADLRRIVVALARGAVDPGARYGPDWRFGLAVLIGTLPIAVIGLAFRDEIETTLRSLWFVGGALIAWSAVMWFRRPHRHPGARRAAGDPPRHSDHRPRPVPGADPLGLALGGDDVRGSAARPRPGHRDPALVLPRDPGADRGHRPPGRNRARLDRRRDRLAGDPGRDAGQLRRRLRGDLLAAALHRRSYLQRLHRLPGGARAVVLALVASGAVSAT